MTSDRVSEPNDRFVKHTTKAIYRRAQVLPCTWSFLPRNRKNRQSSSIPIRFSSRCANRLKNELPSTLQDQSWTSLKSFFPPSVRFWILLTLLWKETWDVNKKVLTQMKTEATWTGKEEKLCLKATSTWFTSLFSL